MDDNKINPGENQSQDGGDVQMPNQDVPAPIYESVPVEEQHNDAENLPAEEIPPDVSTPVAEEIAKAGPEAPADVPPAAYEENKYKYLIIVGGVVVFFILLVFFAKALLGKKSPPKNVKLVYWGLWEDKEVYEPLIESYRKKNPNITIDYQKMTPSQYRDKLLSRSQSGKGPDIFRFHNTWLPTVKDILAPLPGSVMSNSEFEKTFYKIHQKDLKVGQYYYGLPLTIDGMVLICNESMLKQAGVDTIPVTWDEVTDAATKITVQDKEGQIITSGIALGTASNIEHFADILGLMILQNGGSIKQLDQKEAVEALQIYRKLAEPPQQMWNENMPNSTTAFIQEKVAMILAPSWEVMVIKTANPDIKIKVAPVPSVPMANPISIANYWVEGVSRFSQNQLEAWKFLRYLVEKENLTKMYEIESKMRLFGEPYSRTDMAQLLVQNEYAGAVIKQADYYESIPTITRTFDEGVNDDINKYLENAINATIQGVSYSEALKTAKQGIDQVYTKYKIQ